MGLPPPIVIATDVARRLEAVLEHAPESAAEVVAKLEEELARAELREPSAMPDDVVTMHSRVGFLDETSGATHEARLVYPQEAGQLAGDVSILSPAGAALIGLSVGQSIDWPLPGGRTTRFRVTRVAAPPSH